MSIRKRKKISNRHKHMRRNRRRRLKAAGKNPDDVFYSGIYLGNVEK